MTCVLVAAASLAPAQKVVSAKSGLIYFSLGRVWVDDAPLKSGEIFLQLKTAELLHTSRGRAGVLLNPGAVLWLGNNSQLRMDDITLIDSSLSLLAGSAVVTITNAPKPDRVELHFGGGMVTLARDGVYRFDSGPNQARLRVFYGRAEVRRDPGSAPLQVHGGASMEMDGLQAVKFDTKDIDALDRWAQSRPKPPAPGGLAAHSASRDLSHGGAGAAAATRRRPRPAHCGGANHGKPDPLRPAHAESQRAGSVDASLNGCPVRAAA